MEVSPREQNHVYTCPNSLGRYIRDQHFAEQDPNEGFWLLYKRCSAFLDGGIHFLNHTARQHKLTLWCATKRWWRALLHFTIVKRCYLYSLSLFFSLLPLFPVIFLFFHLLPLYIFEVLVAVRSGIGVDWVEDMESGNGIVDWYRRHWSCQYKCFTPVLNPHPLNLTAHHYDPFSRFVFKKYAKSCPAC